MGKTEKEIFAAGFLAGLKARPSALVSMDALTDEPDLLDQFMRLDWEAFELGVPGPLDPFDPRRPHPARTVRIADDNA
jgi:hypothetical protein